MGIVSFREHSHRTIHKTMLSNLGGSISKGILFLSLLMVYYYHCTEYLILLVPGIIIASPILDIILDVIKYCDHVRWSKKTSRRLEL